MERERKRKKQTLDIFEEDRRTKESEVAREEQVKELV